MARIVLGEKYEKSFREIPLSNNTVKRRIALMSEDIKDQVINEIKDMSVFGLFAIQLDESVDVSSVSQLMVFVRYAVSTSIKEELLFCSALDTTTKASDVMEKVNHFFTKNETWKNLCAVCTDGAPAMLGSKSGFRALVQRKVPNVMFTHCFIHREALAQWFPTWGSRSYCSCNNKSECK
uniref:Zinc finger BED domain-containing protein 5-like n=1 Tax=Phallusia mammillata TaxID=59560 RepID=A0A6F9DXU2_9ASCI|nr:zinc finger BED domain-containing protein 5-like [Phallusia mammillata]